MFSERRILSRWLLCWPSFLCLNGFFQKNRAFEKHVLFKNLGAEKSIGKNSLASSLAIFFV
jgi:hypothetical protein